MINRVFNAAKRVTSIQYKTDHAPCNIQSVPCNCSCPRQLLLSIFTTTTTANWLLLFMLSGVTRATDWCVPPQATRFSLNAASHRNSTGHWIVLVSTKREDPRGKLNDSSVGAMSLDVEHSAGSCQNTHSAQLLALATFPSLSRTAVPAGYEMLNGLAFYKMHVEPIPWTEARDKCLAEGSHLIIINSEQEAEVVRTLHSRESSKIKGSSNSDKLHVGFNECGSEGHYVTVLGEPIASTGYTKWYSGQPSGGNENCGIVYKNALLMDEVCTYKLAFICEL